MLDLQFYVFFSMWSHTQSKDISIRYKKEKAYLGLCFCNSCYYGKCESPVLDINDTLVINVTDLQRRSHCFSLNRKNIY